MLLNMEYMGIAFEAGSVDYIHHDFKAGRAFDMSSFQSSLTPSLASYLISPCITQENLLRQVHQDVLCSIIYSY